LSSEDNEDNKKPTNNVSKEGLQANKQSSGNNLTKDCNQIESIIRNAASQFASNLTKDGSINTLIEPIASQFASKIVDELKNKIPDYLAQPKKDEIKRLNEIDFAMHELSDNTALTITVIIGIFGVLTLFGSSGSGAQDILQSVKPLWANGFWWLLGKEMILSVTYCKR
jgi:hypothetical protein